MTATTTEPRPRPRPTDLDLLRRLLTADGYSLTLAEAEGELGRREREEPGRECERPHPAVPGLRTHAHPAPISGNP